MLSTGVRLDKHTPDYRQALGYQVYGRLFRMCDGYLTESRLSDMNFSSASSDTGSLNVSPFEFAAA
ncbi:hypothetical protein [Paenibacillus sp. RC84]|uniref:hypothetical protein n=1 Tax=Paenibacillus sp. RC84 TaxID=3156252 RepID=UPI0035161873